MSNILFFEGPPGAGKSTQIEAVGNVLGANALVFPRLDIKTILGSFEGFASEKHGFVPEMVMLHLEEVTALLLDNLYEEKKWILVERSFVTTMAWNWIKKSCGHDDHIYEELASRYCTRSFRYPHRFVYLRVPVDVASLRDREGPHQFMANNLQAFVDFYDEFFHGRSDTIRIETERSLPVDVTHTILGFIDAVS